MEASKNIAIAILAAGGASRMGKPKQLLKWGKSTLIEHSINVALGVKVAKIYVVLGANYQQIAETINTYPITILKNDLWRQGMGSSIATVVKAISEDKPTAEGILFLLVDQPFIETVYLLDIINAFEPNKQAIIATKYPKDKKGVPVIFDKTYFSKLALLNDDTGAKNLIDTFLHHVKLLESKVPNYDIDTVNDYKKCLELKCGKNSNITKTFK